MASLPGWAIEATSSIAAPAVKAGTSMLGRLVPEAARSLVPPVRRSAGQVPGDINVISQGMFGVRRSLEAQKPEIPRLLDEGWQNMHRANRQFDEMLSALTKKTGIGPGDPRLQSVIDASEGKLPVTALDPVTSELHTFWTAARDKFATQMGLQPGQKLQDYFTHVVEPLNVPRMMDVLADRAPLTVLSPADQIRLKAINSLSQQLRVPVSEALDIYRMTNVGLKDMVDSGQIPRNVFNAFEQVRKGFPVYSRDFYDVMRTYARTVNRQYHLEPALRQVSTLAETLPPNLKQELNLRIQHGILRRPTQTDSLINRAFAPFDTFLQTVTGGRAQLGARAGENTFRSIYQNLALWNIGFNPSPIKKHFVADMRAIYAELGERSTMAGLTKMLDPQMQKLATTAGNVQERLPDLELFDEYLPTLHRGARKLWSGVHKAAFYAYTKVDLINQYTAWIGAYDKATRLGVRLRPVADNIARGMAPEQAIIEYANAVTRYTVPRQTPLDIPGLMKSQIGRLAFQFSSKKMQAAELIWDQFKRAGRGDFGPLGRTILLTAVATGLPGDEWFAKKTGIDPERLPFYDLLGKAGFGMRKVLHSWAPSLGPALQVAADVARVGHDPTRLTNRIFGGLADSPIGRDIYTDRPPLTIPGTGVSPVPLAARSALRFAREYQTGERRSRFGEKIAATTPKEAVGRLFGFDEPESIKLVQQFADAMSQYHDYLGDVSHEVSFAYDRNIKAGGNNWSNFFKDLTAIQQRYPDVLITDSLVQRAVERSEIDRMTRLQRRAPRGFLSTYQQTQGAQ